MWNIRTRITKSRPGLGLCCSAGVGNLRKDDDEVSQLSVDPPFPICLVFILSFTPPPTPASLGLVHSVRNIGQLVPGINILSTLTNELLNKLVKVTLADKGNKVSYSALNNIGSLISIIECCFQILISCILSASSSSLFIFNSQPIQALLEL